METQIIEMAGKQKPMVTREQYDQARAVLDALPFGIYLHCSGCGKWQSNGSITIDHPDQYLCEECA